MEEMLLNRYVVEGEAGSGGFASVLVAWDTRIERRVAIKCMPLDEAVGSARPYAGSILLGAETEKAFSSGQPQGHPVPEEGLPWEEPVPAPASSDPADALRDLAKIPGLEEARTAAKLSDSSIVQVYDFEVQGNTAYLILEYVEGSTLEELLRVHPDEIDADVVAAVFKAVARALKKAHAKHVLHLDIKPANVLIDRAGQVKVTDFGLARLAGEAGYGAAAGGTIGYMPPEQIQQRDLDVRCDEWALASLTYEMISGVNPFFAPTLASAEDVLYDAELVVPSLCMEGLDESIDDIMFCALDPEREGRYETIAQFAEEMQQCLGSPRKGTNKLVRLVGLEGQEEDPDFDETQEQDAVPAAVRSFSVSPRMQSLIMRAACALGAAATAAVGLQNIDALGGWGSPVSWVALAVVAVLAGVLPGIGSATSFAVLGVAFCFNAAPVPGVLLVLAAALWWYFTGRYSQRSALIASFAVLLGGISMFPFVPLVAGFALRMRDAFATTALTALAALCLAGLGSASLVGWGIFQFFDIRMWVDINANLIDFIQYPSTWIMAASWLLAALAGAALCGFARRWLGVVGMLVGTALLIAGLVAGSLADSVGAVYLTNALDVIPVVASAVIMVAAASLVVVPRNEDDIPEEEEDLIWE